MGEALAEIRSEKLYRAAGFTKFEDYTKTRWNLTRAEAYRAIDAVKVVEVVSPNGDNQPANAAQVRELAPLVRMDPEAAKTVWEKIQEEERDGTTAAKIREHVRAKVEELSGQKSERRTRIPVRTRLDRISLHLATLAETLPSIDLRGEDVDDLFSDIERHAGRVRNAAKKLRTGKSSCEHCEVHCPRGSH